MLQWSLFIFHCCLQVFTFMCASVMEIPFLFLVEFPPPNWTTSHFSSCSSVPSIVLKFLPLSCAFADFNEFHLCPQLCEYIISFNRTNEASAYADTSIRLHVLFLIAFLRFPKMSTLSESESPCGYKPTGKM